MVSLIYPHTNPTFMHAYTPKYIQTQHFESDPETDLFLKRIKYFWWAWRIRVHGPTGNRPNTRQGLSLGDTVKALDVRFFLLFKHPRARNRNSSTKGILKDTRSKGRSPLQGKILLTTLGNIQVEFYKEKTSTPRRSSRLSTTIKTPIPSQVKVRIIYPL